MSSMLEREEKLVFGEMPKDLAEMEKWTARNFASQVHRAEQWARTP